MKTYTALLKALVLGCSLLAGSAQAFALFSTFDNTLTTADPFQLGRLSRNGVAQDWIGTEAFPGVVNAATSYRYHTFQFNVGNAPYVEISVSSGSTLLASAYQTSFQPGVSLATNWLGDAGNSGQFFGVDSLFFQVIAIPNSVLTLVITETTGAAGALGGLFTLTADGFIDTDRNDPLAFRVPEPETLLLMLAPLALLAASRRARKGRPATAA